MDSTTWVTTDTHIGHENIKRFCNRPDNCDELIMKGLEIMKMGDILIHVGDVAFNDKGEKRYVEILHDMGIFRWLILGNHDKSIRYHLEMGWDWAGESMNMRRYGKLIKFSHRPTPLGEEDIQIHGHFHNNPLENCEGYLVRFLTSKHKLLILEDVEYKPVPLEKLVG